MDSIANLGVSKELVEFNKNLKHPILKSEREALSFDGLYLYYQLHGMLCSINNDFNGAYNYSEKILISLNKHPHIIEERPDIYWIVLHNLIHAQNKLGKYNESLININKFNSITTNSESLKSKIFYSFCYFELSIFINLGKFDKGVVFIEKIKDQVQKNLIAFPSVKYEHFLFISFAYIYFGVGNFVTAKKYLYKVINETLDGYWINTQGFARILFILIYFELGEKDFLPYLIKSTYKFVNKKKKLHSLDAILLSFLRNMFSDTKKGSNHNNDFKKLKLQIQEFMKNSKQVSTIVNFDLISWIESKIQKRPFAEIVQGKQKIKYIPGI